MFAWTNKFSKALRRCLFIAVLGFSIVGATRSALAAPETPLQARLHHDQAKVRAISRSVVKLMLKVDDHMAYVGTGVYVENNGKMFLLTAAHVISVEGQLPENLGDKLLFRAFNADPDDASEWHSIGQYAATVKRVPGADFAAFELTKAIDGLVPAKIAALPAVAGDRVIAFGFAASDGHMLSGAVTGEDAVNGDFVALKIGADHGDSGGPVFDARTGMLIGLISSSADPSMTEKFSVRHGDSGDNESTWERDANAMGADTLAVHLPALLSN